MVLLKSSSSRQNRPRQLSQRFITLAVRSPSLIHSPARKSSMICIPSISPSTRVQTYMWITSCSATSLATMPLRLIRLSQAFPLNSASSSSTKAQEWLKMSHSKRQNQKLSTMTKVLPSTLPCTAPRSMAVRVNLA